MSIATATTGVTFQDAVDHLYRAFDEVAFRPEMPRCAHCVSDGDLRSLQIDVRQLDPTVVARFVTKAGTTWGEAQDLQRIAPRALHLAAEQSLPVNRAVVLHKLASADWGRWPAHQVDAVCRFLLAEWDRLLSSQPRPGHAAHRWIRQTATAMADLGPFLHSWQRELEHEPGPAAVHLAVLLVNSELRPDFPATVVDLFDPVVRTDAPTSVATGSHPDIDLTAIDLTGTNRTGLGLSLGQPDQTAAGPATAPATVDLADQLGSWLAAPAIEASLSRSASALDHTPDARRLTLAVERLRRFRTARARAT